jgi:glutamate-5-semialdehyde dehydrogenase
MSDTLKTQLLAIGQKAREASRAIGRAGTGEKNKALESIADRLEATVATLIAENSRDLEAGRAKGLDEALLDRLELNESRIRAMAQGVREVAQLGDPIGEVQDLAYRPSGIQVGRMRVPLGVIGIIYESRPNVTADAAALCLKSGNATILRGGSESIHSNRAIAACIRAGLRDAGLHEDTVQLIETTDRAAVGELLKLDRHVDVIIPLMASVMSTSMIVAIQKKP